jgi:hypothetical protein
MRRTPLASIAARTLAAALAIATLSGAVVVSCAGDPAGGGDGGASAPASHAMGRWTPLAPHDTCTKEFHDSFFVVGPDGKKYPTWHAPEEVDPATGQPCRFGHDHGLDPRNSALWPDLQRHFGFDANRDGMLDSAELAVSGIPFGHVAEQLEGTATPRPEEHTGYKVAFADGVTRTRLVNGVPQAFDLACHLFAAYNQGASSADAFASNLFSVIYALDCNRGAARPQYPVKLIVSVMGIYGAPGSFTIDVVNGVPVLQDAGAAPVPPNSPPGGSELGRQIPARGRAFAHLFVPSGQLSDYNAGLAERWDTFLRLRRADGTELATLVPAFVVFNPARYFDAGLARTINLCYFGLDAAGNLITDPSLAGSIVRQARGGACAVLAPDGPRTPLGQRLAFDAPAPQQFNACRRAAFFGADVVRNAAGPTIWYTDAFGANARTVSFARSVRQFIAVGDTGSIVLAEARADLPQCGSSFVHAPN